MDATKREIAGDQRTDAETHGVSGTPGAREAVDQPASGDGDGALPKDGRWFLPVADFLGSAYLKNAFTKGTVAEMDSLLASTGLAPGSTVLDVGCGPGRHSLELARRGFSVTGVDLAEVFITEATESAQAEGLDVRFIQGDARELATLVDGQRFDLVLSLCQGAFGLLGGDDNTVLDLMASLLAPDGWLVLTAFSSYFAVSGMEDGESFNARHGVVHEQAMVRDNEGRERPFDLWTTCFTPRELTLMVQAAGLAVVSLSGVKPGWWKGDEPSIDHPEFLVLARVLGAPSETSGL